ncbi:MAG: hypothetical protein JJE47_08925 [Acidimicrobiia bacterium]|nr:hypothetical protein [Acidimicrobiia bacterium]
MKLRSANRLFLALSLIGLIVIAGLPFGGWVRWSLTSERPIDVLVYDSTVVDDLRREHSGVGLMMTYLKVPFNGATDYVGSGPGGLPFGTWPDERPDLVLLVDAYGVYVNELADVDANGTVRVSQTFPPSFARDVARWADEGTVVMAEFNMMHEPTDPGTSEMLQSIFGIDATGWVGRAFEDLQDAGPRVRSLHAGAWDYQGPGIVIVGSSVGTRTRDPALVVLQSADLESPRPRITGSSADEREELDVSFDSWFALIEADSGADTQLWINLPVNDRGTVLLEEWGIAQRSPFLVWNDNTVYAAGNLASTPAAFPARHIAGALPVMKRLAADGNAALFYRVYAPLVERLVQMADR